MKKQQRESDEHGKPSAAETVASCDDLLRELFVRVPLKALVRFKSVCKLWKSLISDPNLHLAHNRNRRPKPAVGLICQPHPTATSFAYIVPFDKSALVDLPKLPDHLTTDVTIVHSCNGLLLLRADAEPRHHFVFNPTTTEFTKLPKPPTSIGKKSTGTQAMCLAYDPSKSPHYKVVHVARHPSYKEEYRFVVYSTETGSWGYTVSMEAFTRDLDIQRGMYWNGAVHWFSTYSGFYSVYINLEGIDHKMIMPRVFPTPPMPHRVRDIERVFHFGESCGHLHFVGHEEYPRDELKVYELRTDYSEWFLKYKIRGDVIGHPIFALIRAEKEEEDCFVVFGRGGTIFRYNIFCQTLETLIDLTNPWSTKSPPLPNF